MRCSAILTLAAAVASVSAAGLNRRQASYPACAISCIQNADFGTCDPVDDACLCKSDAFVQGTTTCIAGACSGSDLQQAESAAQSACEAVGVTLSSAPAATSTAPASSASATASASVTSTSAAAPSQTSNAASSRGVNALAALAAVGAAALAL
ncbi:hypothetical protein TRAPUB_3220 [Trametes pubescens]|uniref:CFEM domain-containing protein n=1 Tax=Trametes pubescens TaxID=154538 RepID=A0A1M2VEC3_TRAPU|nr:hypothetical protein TRAPUB_3220 [Trametes pubescens]